MCDVRFIITLILFDGLFFPLSVTSSYFIVLFAFLVIYLLYLEVVASFYGISNILYVLMLLSLPE